VLVYSVIKLKKVDGSCHPGDASLEKSNWERALRRSSGSPAAARSCSDWLPELLAYQGSGLKFSRRSDEFTDYHLHQQYTYIRQARKHTNKQPKLLACLPIYGPLLACASTNTQAACVMLACWAPWSQPISDSLNPWTAVSAGCYVTLANSAIDPQPARLDWGNWSTLSNIKQH
jgi:hypothetical protein